MLFMLNMWKAMRGGPMNATPFLKAMESPRTHIREKEILIEGFDDWDIILNTWFEMADFLPAIEQLFEDKTFNQRLRAALVASKVAFCLEDYSNALHMALAAEDVFQLTPRPKTKPGSTANADEEYVNKMIEVALDAYKTGKRDGTPIDPRLEALINRLFERNLEKKEMRFVIGLALDTRRVDMVERAIKESNEVSALLTETVQKVLDGQYDALFRNQLLDLLLTIFAGQESPDFVSICQCLIKLEKPAEVADLLKRLIDKDGELLAYQIAFDLYENATQQFICKILTALNPEGEEPSPSGSVFERAAASRTPDAAHGSPHGSPGTPAVGSPRTSPNDAVLAIERRLQEAVIARRGRLPPPFPDSSPSTPRSWVGPDAAINARSSSDTVLLQPAPPETIASRRPTTAPGARRDRSVSPKTLGIIGNIYTTELAAAMKAGSSSSSASGSTSLMAGTYPSRGSSTPTSEVGLRVHPTDAELPMGPASPTPAPAVEKLTPQKRLSSILRGEETIKHHMQFLIKNNHTDMLVLKEMKDCVRNATAHNATLMANGIMHLGTTCDDFLRDNLDWISKATNWNKFNAVASLGLIHKGHESAAMKLLDPYLPKTEADQFGYKEGGSLYAVGLIHANHGNKATIAYLREQLAAAQTSALRHGACLGLGLAAMGTHDHDVYQQLRDALVLDDAVTGEAAGLAMGLVMVGSLHQSAYQEMVQYVCDTQHDKIQRGLRTGIALLAYGRQEESEQWITQLLENKSNAVLRSTGVCMLAMSYVGTGKANVATRLLEKVATDPNNDVKRFAVMAIGFLLSNDPEICLSYVGMLVEHFNSHVRYGAAMALGIACTGSGYKEAIHLLEPLMSAKENFVRQGAVVALSFIMVQQTEQTCPKVVDFRKTLTKMITEKSEDSMAKFGAIIAQGILDAGGRNLTVSMHNRNGYPDLGGVVGMMVFQQFWYWHSMVHFVSLATKPTCLIALNKELRMPKMEFKCNAKASLFAYPPALENKKNVETEKVETAVLSITNKKKTRGESTQAPASRKESTTTEPKEEKMEVDPPAGEEKKPEEKKAAEPEAPTHNLENPARVVRLQLKTLAMPEGARYKPVKVVTQGGIIMVLDKKPEDKEELVAQVIAGGTTTDPAAPEKEPHSTFEIDNSDY